MYSIYLQSAVFFIEKRMAIGFYILVKAIAILLHRQSFWKQHQNKTATSSILRDRRFISSLLANLIANVGAGLP